MELAAQVCAVLLCLNILFQVSENKDIKIRFTNFTSSKSDDKLLADVKELNKALEELILSNEAIYDSLNAAQPPSALLKQNRDLDFDVDEEELKKEALISEKDTPRTLKIKLDDDEEFKFGDLLSLPPPVFSASQLKMRHFVNINQQNENKSPQLLNEIDNKNKTDEINNKTVSSNNTEDILVNPKVKRQVQDEENLGDQVLKLMKEDKMDDPYALEGLEDITDDLETEAPPVQHNPIKGINGKYLMKIIRVKNKVAEYVNEGIGAIKQVSREVLDKIKSLGKK